MRENILQWNLSFLKSIFNCVSNMVSHDDVTDYKNQLTLKALRGEGGVPHEVFG